MSQLPCIVNVAQENGLEINVKTLTQKEVLCKCPFCHGDAGRRGKYKLSLNPEKKVFKCWLCKKSGGVLQFESLLTGKSFAEVKKKYFGDRKRPYHPAEFLSPQQLEAINWQTAKQQSYQHFKNKMDDVLRDWKEHEYQNKRLALAKLFVADTTGKINVAIESIQKQEKESQIPDLTTTVLDVFSSRQWEESWIIESLRMAVSSVRASMEAGENGENALIYLTFLNYFYENNMDVPITKSAVTKVTTTVEPSKEEKAVEVNKELVSI